MSDFLAEAKLILRIEQEDVENDKLIEHYITAGQAYLNGLAGGSLDFENSVEHKTLLLHYVRYAFNNAQELFLENFFDDILRMQLIFGTEVMENATSEKP